MNDGLYGQYDYKGKPLIILIFLARSHFILIFEMELMGRYCRWARGNMYDQL